MIVNECKNCRHSFSGNFCNHCGQSADTERINFRFIVYELQRSILRVDGGFLYTSKKLFAHPGKMVKDYIEGKRVRHLKPFSYLLINCGLYILLYHAFDINVFTENVEQLDRSTMNRFFYDHYVALQLCLLPFYALLSVFFFRLQPYNFYEFIVIHCYLIGQRILIGILALPLVAWKAGLIHPIQYLTLVFSVGMTVWTFIWLFRDRSKAWIVFKVLSMQLAGLILLSGIVYLLVQRLEGT